MDEDWRKKKRRRIRSAPLERPKVLASPELRSDVAEQLGPMLSVGVLAAFEAGGLPGTPEEFHALEGQLLEVARKHRVGWVLSAVLRAVHSDDSFVLWSMGRAQRESGLRALSDRAVTVLVAGGQEVTLTTPYMAPKTPKAKSARRKRGGRGKGGAGLFPVLAALGLLGKVTPKVASTVAGSATQLASFEEAAESLTSLGFQLDPETVRQITFRVADAGLADRESHEPIDEDVFAGKRVVICPDGGRIRCRYDKPGRRRKSGFHGFETPWQEPKVFVAYAVDDKGEKISDELSVYEGTLAPWKDAVAVAANTMKRYGLHRAKEVAVAADGSENIWREIGRMVELVGLDSSKVTFFVDLYHALEHLHDAAKLSTRFKTDKQRQQWVTKRAHWLKRGQIVRVIVDLRDLPTADEDAADRLHAECEYFRTRIDKMHYGELKRSGWPLGTGAVESAIRRIVNLRMKNPGTFWKPENAERLLYLRCRQKAGRWSEVENALHRAALQPARAIRPAILDFLAA